MLKIQPYRNEKHLNWIRSKPCCHCWKPPNSHAHHLIGIFKNGIMGGKQDDSLTIPLCGECHALVHQDVSQIDQLHYFTRLMKQAFQNGEIILITKK